MTVAELIARLRTLPQDVHVVVRSPTYATAKEIEDDPCCEYFHYDKVYNVESAGFEAYIDADVSDDDDQDVEPTSAHTH